MSELDQRATVATQPSAAPSPWRHRFPLLLIILSGTALSLILFSTVREAETRRVQADFERRASLPISAIQDACDEHVILLRSIAAFFFSSRAVDRHEFRAFTEEALRRLPSVQAVVWAPRVSAEQRPQHETAVKADGFPTYEINELDPAGTRLRAPPRAAHFPVLYAEPESRAGPLLGLDLSADSLVTTTMNSAVAAGDVLSTPLTITQHAGHRERLYRLLVPVYPNGAAHDAPADRHRNIGGFAVLFLRPSALIEAALKKLPSDHVNSLRFQAIDVTKARDAVYVSSNWHDTQKPAPFETRFEVRLAGRTWRLLCQPAPGSIVAHPWQSYAVLLSTLALTALLAGYLSALWGRAAKVELTVIQRTAELARINVNLTREIAARKEIADALARERYLVDALMDSIPDHIYFKDPQSRFLRINKSMAQSFGLSSPAQAIGKTDFDFFTSEHAQRAFDDEQQILRTGKPLINREEKETWPDSSVTWVSTTKDALRDHHGNTIGTFGISRDITDRKKAEQSLADKANELQRSNTELEQFAYVASHDLQEPLRMVASYTQLLARRYHGRLDPDADQFISYAVEGATRMQDLINDLLAWSRVGTRGKPFAVVPCATVLARTLDNLKITFDETGACLTHDPLPAVLGDATQLTQLFQNLIANAIKFRCLDRPCQIHLSVTSRRVSASDHCSCEWLFSLRDNGIGIEDKYFDRIFVIFQRLHTRDQYPGTGIGLAVCKKIVERHGGRIWVESTPGKGSTFHFTLPTLDLCPA